MLSAVRRAVTCALVLALTAFAYAGSGPAVADDGPQVDPRPASDAFAWLKRNLSMDMLLDGDVDLTWRAALIFPHSQLEDLARAHFDDYVGDPAAARTARLARAIEIGFQMRRNVTALADELASRMLTSGPAAGRFADRAPGPAYVGTADQAYATYVLSFATGPNEPGRPTVPAAASTPARAFLLHQQCDDGGFRPQPAEVGAMDQDCHGSAPRTRDSLLATAEALRGLQRGIYDSSDTYRALKRAGEWLIARQSGDGSFGDLVSDAAGVAAVEDGLFEYDSMHAQWAAGWVRGLQAHDAGSCVTALRGETGAVAPDSAALDRARRVGIAPAERDAWVRSTIRGLSALQWAVDMYSYPNAKDVQMGGPTRVHGGSLVRLGIGANWGDSMCLTGPGTKLSLTARPAYQLRMARVRVPARTGHATYVLTNSAGERDAVTLAVLGAKHLGVTVGRHRVHRHHRVRVVATGLAAHERVTLRYLGKVRHATADAHGRYRTNLAVGVRRGKHTVTVVGQFVDRRGHTMIRVVR